MVWWVVVAAASEVTVSIDRYRDLIAPEALEPAPAPFVERRDVRVWRRGDELVVEARFRVAVPEPGPVAFTVAGPELRVERFTVDGRVTALGGGAGGPVFAAALARPVELVLVGAVDADDRSQVSLLGAGAGELLLPEGLALEGGLALGKQRWVPALPDRTLDTLVFSAPPAPESDRGELVFGRVGYGLTIVDGEVRRAARLQWRVVSGTIERVAFTVPGAGPDLRVEGVAVGEVVRSGDRVDVTLSSPEGSVVEVLVHTSQALGTGEVQPIDLGLPQLHGVFRTDSAVVVARDGELDVVPHVTGLAPRSVLSLPEVTAGLVDGSPYAAFAGAGGGGTFDVLRFTPAEGPATLCDVATYTVALTDDGRRLVRAHYTIRNDRGHLLRITPPAGLRPIAAQVSQRPVTVSRDGDSWLVPLDKSVESVAGLLTFPVEVAFLGEGPPLRSRVLEQALALPTIDAETAVVRATVHLPPGFEDRTRVGRGDRVGAFSEGEGITYGFGIGDVRAAVAEDLWQQALSSWNENSFDEAQDALNRITELGGSNENVYALQGNLDVVTGKKSAETSVDRRIKDQARARAISDFEEQRRLLEEAERATNEGRYDEAEQAYGAASAVTEKLANLSNSEDVAQDEQLRVTLQKNDDNRETLNRKMAYRSQANTVALPQGAAATTPDDGKALGGVSGGVVGGELLEMPMLEGGVSNGAYAVDFEPAPPPATPEATTAPVTAGPARPAEPADAKPPAPAVVATSASVVVPTVGAPVLYQHLLLPAGRSLAVDLRARRANHEPRTQPSPRSRR